jgi:hypothetical protein
VYKFATLIFALTACATSPDRTTQVEQGLCTQEDQDAGLCTPRPSRLNQTRNYGQSQMPSATYLDGGCQPDGVGTQCFVSFDWGGHTYVVTCSWDDVDGTVSCGIE